MENIKGVTHNFTLSIVLIEEYLWLLYTKKFGYVFLIKPKVVVNNNKVNGKMKNNNNNNMPLDAFYLKGWVFMGQ